MHCDTIGRAVKSCEEAYNVEFRTLLEEVKTPSAVFAAAPGKESAFHPG
jgi:hypothetical protein